MSLNGSEIKHVRLRLGLTQKQMARYMGMTQPAVARIERRIGGRKETYGHLAHLCGLVVLGRHGLLAGAMVCWRIVAGWLFSCLSTTWPGGRIGYLYG